MVLLLIPTQPGPAASGYATAVAGTGRNPLEGRLTRNGHALTFDGSDRLPSQPRSIAGAYANLWINEPRNQRRTSWASSEAAGIYSTAFPDRPSAGVQVPVFNCLFCTLSWLSKFFCFSGPLINKFPSIYASKSRPSASICPVPVRCEALVTGTPVSGPGGQISLFWLAGRLI